MESLGLALAVKRSVAFWDWLKARYLAPRNPGGEDGVAVAVALAACANRIAARRPDRLPAALREILVWMKNGGLHGIVQVWYTDQGSAEGPTPDRMQLR